jgi:hypothetical protein
MTHYWIPKFYRLASPEDEMDDRVAKVFGKVLILIGLLRRSKCGEHTVQPPWS